MVVILAQVKDNCSAWLEQFYIMLKYSSIVCIDEATANVDQETDKFIQATIKSSFQTATVLTIAHRIRTIMYCDRYVSFTIYNQNKYV